MSIASWGPRRRWFAAAVLSVIAAALVIAPLFLIPVPYFVFGPGAAVNLDNVVRVPARTPPPGAVYLTDVRVFPGRPAYYAIAKVLPGFEIVPRGRVAAPNENDAALNRRLVDAMRESQLTAQVVAEAAAGYKVSARHSFVVERLLPKSPGAKCFRIGDDIVAIDGKSPQHPDSLVRATQAKPAGSAFHLLVMRGRKTIDVTCSTKLVARKPRFGIAVEAKTDSFSVPIHVSFDTDGINGSSAGLMFALQIYRSLTGKPLGGGRAIAGTGVLGFDGSVNAIEGVNEKLQAARRVGASVFLVPKDNAGEIHSPGGMRILPVSTFAGALNSLQSL